MPPPVSTALPAEIKIDILLLFLHAILSTWRLSRQTPNPSYTPTHITNPPPGIGRATALAFAREGATVICSDIRESARPDMAEASELTTVQELEKMGTKCAFVKCDTSQAQEVEALVKRAVELYGRLDM